MLFCCCYHQLSGIQQKQSCLMGLSLKKKKLDFYQFFKGKSPLGMSSPPRPIACCRNWVFSSHFMPFHQPETPTTMRRWRCAASSFPPPFYPHLSIPSIFTLLQKVLMGSVLRGEIHGWVGRAAVGWICRIHCRAWMLLSWFTFLVEEDPRGPSLVKQFFISMI